MTEQDNTAVIQKIYAAFGTGNIQTILDSLTPDVEWIMEGPEIIPYAGRRVGPNEVTQFFEALATTQDNHSLTITDYIAQGDKVATVGRYSADVKATAKRIDCAVAHVFTIRDGKIAAFVDFADTAHMAAAYTSATATSATATARA